MEAILINFIQGYPHLSTILMIIGFLRLIIKPIMTILKAYVAITPTNKDNETLDKIFNSKYWTGFLFLLDWFTSIKVK